MNQPDETSARPGAEWGSEPKPGIANLATGEGFTSVPEEVDQ
jgi:hypothetical protein